MTDKYEDEILEGEVSDDDDQEENKKEPEKYCTLCHRAESQVGKMIDLPNNIHICPDCMQRSFDSMNQQMQTGNFNYGDLLNMPNVSMIDLSSFQNQMGQQPKPKKKKSEKKDPVLDLKKIPAPHKIKAFYMKLNEDGKTVAAMDCLVPGIGEIIGGSQREDDYDKLRTRMDELGLKPEDYDFYLDLRKYGSTRHSGFGLGFERCVMYLTGMGNIRDVIPFPRTVKNCDL